MKTGRTSEGDLLVNIVRPQCWCRGPSVNEIVQKKKHTKNLMTMSQMYMQELLALMSG